MRSQGKKLISELKSHVLEVVKGIPECQPGGKGVTYRDIQDLAGLDLNLPVQDGWLTWSILAALHEDGIIESEKRGRRIFWRLSK